MSGIAPDFERLFVPGAVHPFPDSKDSLAVKVLPGVPLSLPSGRVIAMEPYSCGFGDPDELSFTEQVPPGTYAVVLVTVDVIGPDGAYLGDTRVAAARLVIRDEPVTTWELALQPGQDVKDLGDGEYYGYEVVGGTGCFVDAETFHVLKGEEDFADRVVSAMWNTELGAPVGPMSEHADDPVTVSVGDDEHAVVVFSTGWGDGAYATWIGRTANGDIACFLSDFQALPD